MGCGKWLLWWSLHWNIGFSLLGNGYHLRSTACVLLSRELTLQMQRFERNIKEMQMKYEKRIKVPSCGRCLGLTDELPPPPLREQIPCPSSSRCCCHRLLDPWNSEVPLSGGPRRSGFFCGLRLGGWYFRDVGCRPAAHFHPFLVLRRRRLGNRLTTGAFLMQWSPLVPSHGAANNAPARAPGAVSIKFGTLVCSRKGGLPQHLRRRC